MKYDVILASGSPRRKEILEMQGIAFRVIKSVAEEETNETEPDKVVCDLSQRKASEIAEREAFPNDTIIIAADTIVAYQNTIMGKPSDEADAKHMLYLLQGNTHQVYTGVTVILIKESQRKEIQFFTCTDVTMYEMTQEEIQSYIQSGEPMDKAGAYAIQGYCARYIQSIRGDYLNVVGLPLSRLIHELKKNGVEL